MICTECGDEFQAEADWMRKCEDCFREGRKSISAAESKNPAYVYERNNPHAFDTPGYTDNAVHVLECLAQARAGLPQPIREEVDQAVVIGGRLGEVESCAHEFVGMYLPACRRCGITEHEWRRYIASIQGEQMPIEREELPPIEGYGL